MKYAWRGPELREEDAEPACLLVGQAPSETSNPNEPLTGQIGRRLARWAGLSYEDYLSSFDRVNLLYEYPGRQGRGDSFPLKPARKTARELLEHLPSRVILLGSGVANAFQLQHLTPLVPETVYIMKRGGGQRIEFILLPHPSARAIWWMRKENMRKAKRLLHTVAERGTI